MINELSAAQSTLLSKITNARRYKRARIKTAVAMKSKCGKYVYVRAHRRTVNNLEKLGHIKVIATTKDGRIKVEVIPAVQQKLDKIISRDGKETKLQEPVRRAPRDSDEKNTADADSAYLALAAQIIHGETPRAESAGDKLDRIQAQHEELQDESDAETNPFAIPGTPPLKIEIRDISPHDPNKPLPKAPLIEPFTYACTLVDGEKLQDELTREETEFERLDREQLEDFRENPPEDVDVDEFHAELADALEQHVRAQTSPDAAERLTERIEAPEPAETPLQRFQRIGSAMLYTYADSARIFYGTTKRTIVNGVPTTQIFFVLPQETLELALNSTDIEDMSAADLLAMLAMKGDEAAETQ